MMKAYISKDYTESVTTAETYGIELEQKKSGYKYTGQLHNEKRFMSLGFDDFRETDFTFVIPLLEKYDARATFNVINRSAFADDDFKEKVSAVLQGGHELGDHTWGHFAYPYSDPMFNGQNPDRPDGDQEPFPSNQQLRGDRGDGRNVFGISLDATLYETANYGWREWGGFDARWGELTDGQCQTFREFFSVMKDPSGLGKVLDVLSNQYLGTEGQSEGSWDPRQGCYTGGIFTGCRTSQNHEVWERILRITEFFFKAQVGMSGDLRTWSLPGEKWSPCVFEQNGKYFYDEHFTLPCNYLSAFPSSLMGGEERSLVDVLRNHGYAGTHDFVYPGRFDGNAIPMMRTQLILNGHLSRRDAVLYPTERAVHYTEIESEYPEDFFEGVEKEGRAAKMYQSEGVFFRFLETLRNDTSNGIIYGGVIDSSDTYSERVVLEEILDYCRKTGVEVISKAEAYDLSFYHRLEDGNLIYNPWLRNTAKEFLGDLDGIPSNPDGYYGACGVSIGADTMPALQVNGEAYYLHYGIPNGRMAYGAEWKGSGKLRIHAVRNKDDRELRSGDLPLLKEISYETTEWEKIEVPFIVPRIPAGEFEYICEGFGEKIMGVKITYSGNFEVKNICLRKR